MNLTSIDIRCVECEAPSSPVMGYLLQVNDDDCGKPVHEGACLTTHLVDHHQFDVCRGCAGTRGATVRDGETGDYWEDCPQCDGIGATV